VSQNPISVFIKSIHDFETSYAHLRTASQKPFLVFIKPIHTFEHPGPPRDQGKPFLICLQLISSLGGSKPVATPSFTNHTQSIFYSIFHKPHQITLPRSKVDKPEVDTCQLRVQDLLSIKRENSRLWLVLSESYPLRVPLTFYYLRRCVLWQVVSRHGRMVKACRG